MAKLRCIHQESAEAAPEVSVRFALWGSQLQAHFEVMGCKHPHILHHLSGEGPHWGLWEGDVVELFVRVARSRGVQDYFEFQVSPLGQSFELKVLKPREKIDRSFRSGFSALAERTSPHSWRASLHLDLERLGWSGDRADIEGGAFSILGKPGSRSYHALFLPEQLVPDFHLPGYFRQLFQPPVA